MRIISIDITKTLRIGVIDRVAFVQEFNGIFWKTIARSDSKTPLRDAHKELHKLSRAKCKDAAQGAVPDWLRGLRP